MSKDLTPNFKRESRNYRINKRREFISEYLALGFSTDDIHNLIAELVEADNDGEYGFLVNPNTGKVWSIAVISKDISDLCDLIAEKSALNIKQYIGRELVLCNRIIRESMAEKDYNMVLRAIEMERKVLGIDRRHVDVHVTGGIDIDVRKLSDDDLIEINNIITKAYK